MEFYFEITLENGAKYRARGDESLNLKVSDYCVIRKDFYQDYGQVSKIMGQATGNDTDGETMDGEPFEDTPGDGQFRTSNLPSERKAETPRILRKATISDISKANENQMRCKSTLRTTQQYIERLNLPMKLINAHHAFDGKMIVIQFSAEGRVDFRELVKLLSQEFNTRIELRQIGVRDETAIVGGISMCGRPLCCCVFLNDFASINVKMAKEQDLSLTPSTISGICGRLKCCLKYEHEGYLELEKGMPRRGDCCECKEGRGRVIDRNLLSQKVVVQLEDSQRTVTCHREEVRVVYPEKYKLQNTDQEKPDNNNHGENAQNQNQNQKRKDKQHTNNKHKQGGQKA